MNTIKPIANYAIATVCHTGRVIANSDQIMNDPTVLKRFVDNLRRFTEQEYKSGPLDGTNENIRKTNLYMNLAINQDMWHKTGVLDNPEVKRDADKSMVEARQFHQFFSCLLGFNTSEEIKLLNSTCADLLDLYVRKNDIEAKDNTERSLSDHAKDSAELENLKLQIQGTCELFKKNLEIALKFIALHGEVGFLPLSDKINANSVDGICNFLQMYACKVRYLTEPNYANELRKDLSKFIFARSVGVLSAQLVIEAKYGKFIAHMLSNSFVGNIGASNNTFFGDKQLLSDYFLETLYLLLDDGTDEFNLACLCVKSQEVNSNPGVARFSMGEEYVDACPNSYNLTDHGKEVVTDIINYYADLSRIKISDSEPLICFDEKNQDMLIWNLLGGNNKQNASKRGIFFHLDNLLRECDFKKLQPYTDTDEAHLKFQNEGYRKKFIGSAKEQIKQARTNIKKTGRVENPFKLVLYQEKLELVEIAKHVILTMDSVVVNRKKLWGLRQEYELILNKQENHNRDLLSSYFAMLVKDHFKEFAKIEANIEQYSRPGKDIQSKKKPLPDDLINHFLELQEAKSTKRNFKLKFRGDHEVVHKHINEYMEMLTKLKKQIEESKLFMYIESIFCDLEKLNQFTMFCDEINKGEMIVPASMTRLAPISQLIFMAENAINIAKKSVESIYNYYVSLKKEIESNSLKEENIIHYAMLEMLFDFADKSKGYENYFISELTVDDIEAQKNDLKNGIYNTGNKYFQVLYGTVTELILKEANLPDKLKNNGKLTYSDIVGLFKDYIRDDSTFIKAFVNMYNQIVKNTENETAITFREFKRLNDVYKAIPNNLALIYLSSDIREYFATANKYIADPTFNVMSELEQTINWDERSMNNQLKIPGRKRVLLQQQKGVLLTRTVNKIKDDLGAFTYVRSSMKALESSNRFRLKNIAELQLSIIHSLMLIINNDSPHLTDEQTSFYKKIKEYVDKYIDNSKLDTATVQEVFDTITYCFDQLLESGSYEKETTIKTLDDKVIKISLMCSQQQGQPVAQLYKSLTKVDFSVSLDKVPAMYLAKLQDCNGEVGSLTKAFRIIGALFTIGGGIKKLSIGTQQPIRNNYEKIANTITVLRNFELSSLATIQYLHAELMSNFKVMSHGIGQFAGDLSSSINLVQKILKASLAKQPIDFGALNKNEKTILGSIIQEHQSDLVRINPHASTGIKALLIQLKNYGERELGLNVQLLIDAVKAHLERLNKQDNDDVEFVKLFEDPAEKLNGLGDIKFILEDQERNFAKIMENIAANFEKMKQNKSSQMSVNWMSREIIEKLEELARFYDIAAHTKEKNGVKTYNLSSNAVKKFGELYNLCYETLNYDTKNSGLAYSALFATRSILEESINKLTGENDLINCEISLFSQVDNLAKPDEAIQGMVMKCLRDNPNADMQSCLNSLIKKYSNNSNSYINLKTKNAFKYYLNLTQYQKLSNRLAEFYVSHYFNIKTVEHYYYKTIAYIVSINQQGETVKPIAESSLSNFGNDVRSLNESYKNYRAKSVEILSRHINKCGKELPIYELLVKTKLTFSQEQQIYDVKTHEWLIKMLDINDIFDLLANNNVPHMRMVLCIEGIFDYFAMFPPKSYNDNNAKELRGQLLKLYAVPKSGQSNYKDYLENTMDKLNKFLNKFIIPKEASSIFEKTVKQLKSFFKGLFQKQKDPEALKNEIMKGVSKLIGEKWSDIYKKMNAQLTTYTKYLDDADEYLMKITNKQAQLENLKSLEKFNNELEMFCKEQLNSMQNISNDGISNEIASLIKENWMEFANLCVSNDAKLMKQFEEICSLDFMGSAIEKYLSANYNNIYISISNYKKSFETVLILNFRMTSPNDLKSLFHSIDPKFLTLFLANSPHNEQFRSMIKHNLMLDNFNEQIFTQDVFNFIESHNNIDNNFNCLIKERLNLYGMSNKHTYNNLCKTYVIEQKYKDNYSGDWLDGKRHGQGIYTWDNGDIYEGQWEDGKGHGHGTMRYSNGDIYEGQWEDGKSHGQGTYTSAADGSIYEGQWKDDKKHGHGTCTWANGDIYEGQWEDDKMHGLGTYTWAADGGIFEGQWEDDNPHGQGTYTKADGSIYEGQWEDDNLHGQGTCAETDGSIYEGQWENGKRHGQGTYTWADGDTYEGQWEDSKRHGYGTMRCNDGGIYEGQWEYGKRHGYGTMRRNDGGIYEGQWEYGKRHGQGTYTWADGNTYEGQWKDSKRHGYGILTMSGGDIYEGQWKDGNLHGQGTSTDTNGNIYEGQWKDGKAHGHGTSTDTNGNIYEGQWEDGKRHGYGTLTKADGNTYEVDL